MTENTKQGESFSIDKLPAVVKPVRKTNSVVPTIPYKITELGEIIREHENEEYKKILGNVVVEGDITLFWGPSGTGKSFFAMQLAIGITRGKNFFEIPLDSDMPNDERKDMILKNELPPSDVLFVDFEMGPNKIANRYKGFIPPKGLNILHFDNYAVADRSAYLNTIKNILAIKRYPILIIDNLSNLILETERGDKAAMFMNTLKQTAKEFNLTMIVLNHSNKMNKLDAKVSNQMKGNQNFENYADSVFVISPSTEGTSTRYLKQQKCRYGEEQFGDNNVIKMDLIKMSNGFVGFAFAGYSKEWDMLDPKTVAIDTAIYKLLEQNPAESGTEIAKRLKHLYDPDNTFVNFERRIYYYLKKYSLREKVLMKREKDINDKNIQTL